MAYVYLVGHGKIYVRASMLIWRGQNEMRLLGVGKNRVYVYHYNQISINNSKFLKNNETEWNKFFKTKSIIH